jgi:N-acetylmuramoyl-L-alanine amidase
VLRIPQNLYRHNIIRLAFVASFCLSGCYTTSSVPPSASIQPRGPHPLQSGAVEFSDRSSELNSGENIGSFKQLPNHNDDSFESWKTGLNGFGWKPDGEERKWNSIVLHHTAANRGSVESIHETHIQRKDSKGNPWLGIGYHFVIGNGNGMEDGEVQPTFRWREQLHGAHAGKRSYNQLGIGITLIGNFEKSPPTEAQLNSVKQLVAQLKNEYSIPDDQVFGHSEVKATACPGKLFPLEEVKKAN